MEKKLKPINLYMYICDVYKSDLRFHCQRFSNNSNPTLLRMKRCLPSICSADTVRDTSASGRYILYQGVSVIVVSQASLLPNVQHTLEHVLRSIEGLGGNHDTIIQTAGLRLALLLSGFHAHCHLQRQEQARESGKGDNIQGILFDQEHVLPWQEAAHGRTAKGRNHTVPGNAGHNTCFRK